jgi:GTPase SAR1 family protein
MKEYDSFVKAVVVGDPGVGKTSFLSSFVQKASQQERNSSL